MLPQHFQHLIRLMLITIHWNGMTPRARPQDSQLCCARDYTLDVQSYGQGRSVGFVELSLAEGTMCLKAPFFCPVRPQHDTLHFSRGRAATSPQAQTLVAAQQSQQYLLVFCP
jgi:hypothetical protein